jgi:general secretion pathway protein I
MPRAVRGFTLLEAIVALAVFATVGGALFAWLNQSLAMSARAESQLRRIELTEHLLRAADTINPMLQPSGERDDRNIRLVWDSEQVEPTRIGAGVTHGISFYEIALFRLSLQAHTDETSANVDVLKTGYKLRDDLPDED